MTIKSDVANKSIREAINAIADAIDGNGLQPAIDVSKLQADVQELKVRLDALKAEIDGEPAPAPVSTDLPQPS